MEVGEMIWVDWRVRVDLQGVDIVTTEQEKQLWALEEFLNGYYAGTRTERLMTEHLMTEHLMTEHLIWPNT